MSYDIGQHIDLTYLNRKAVATHQKKSFKQAASDGYAVGTRFIFTLTPNGLKAAIQVPIAFA